MVTSGTVTNRVDRLESRGFVRREREPSDRRGVRVVLTTAGQEAVDGALTDLLDRERELLVGLTPTEQQQLANLLRSLSYEFDS